MRNNSHKIGPWAVGLFALITYTLTPISVLGMRSVASAQVQPQSCFSDWQIVGDVEINILGECQAEIGFPTPTAPGKAQATAFKLDFSRYDPKRPITFTVCRSKTGITPGAGFAIDSDELQKARLYGNKTESQLGTMSSGGKDCLIHTPTSSQTVWLIQPIGHPDEVVFITVNGVPLVAAPLTLTPTPAQ